jgi:hypothetical protein
MRYELNQFKALFEQIRDLGITMKLPNTQHTSISDNLSVWFDRDYEVTAIYFGNAYNEKVEIIKYSNRDNNYKLTLPIDMTDTELNNLLAISTKEYKQVKVTCLMTELELAISKLV